MRKQLILLEQVIKFLQISSSGGG